VNIQHYAKYVVAILGVILGATAAAIADGRVTGDEAVNLLILTLGAFATYLVPNLDHGLRQYAKLIVAALTAGATLLSSVVSDGVTLAEWLMVGAAVLTAFTTYVIPNEPSPAVVTVAAATNIV
jgi:multisubunit Na+/H+ antiporter MnhC subunit